MVPPAGGGAGDTQTQISQLRIAPTLCHLLEIPIPPTMKSPPLG
jgi:hypothetical protein